MTGRFLKERVRAILNDTGRGTATKSRFYSNELIMGAINRAQQELALLLYHQYGDGCLTLTRIIKEAAANGGFTGTAVPTDFWALICGKTTDNHYVPASNIKVGEALLFVSNYRIYAKGGFFYGTGDIAVYLAVPPKMEDSEVDLTTFPDAFYNTVKYRACEILVVKDDRDAMDRQKAFHVETQVKIATIK